MDIALALFSREEITDLLSKEGITPASPAFEQERLRRFRPTETAPGLFVEREDWYPADAEKRFDVC